MAAERKGASSIKDVPSEILEQLERGEIETATLAETLAVNFATLARNVFPGLSNEAFARIEAVNSKGVTVRMRAVGDALIEFAGTDEMAVATSHESDIVRGWAAYTIPISAPLDEQLDAIRPFAEDRHFGVREWAWLSIRNSICAEPLEAVLTLASWAADEDPFARRFASEATRPRGVWATHIAAFKEDPTPARSILDQLCCDPDDYVHRSVGNWLRDASKTVPEWVVDVIDGWEDQHGPQPALDRLRKRAT